MQGNISCVCCRMWIGASAKTELEKINIVKHGPTTKKKIEWKSSSTVYFLTSEII